MSVLISDLAFFLCFELMYYSPLSPFPEFIFVDIDLDDYFMRNLSTDLQMTAGTERRVSVCPIPFSLFSIRFNV